MPSAAHAARQPFIADMIVTNLVRAAAAPT